MELINNTILFTPTKECWWWCKNAHFLHHSNLETQLLFIIFIALICLFINNFILKHSEQILYWFNIFDETLEKTYLLINDFVIYLLITFLIYILWFK